MNTIHNHGGRLDAAVVRYGGQKNEWLDLSTGINPISYPIPDLAPEIWEKLPDTKAEKHLISVARKAYQVPDHMGIVAANGTQALIELLPKVITCNQVSIVSPTYNEHELAWQKSGSHIELIKKDDPIPLGTNGLVTVNPNNPDGSVYSVQELLELANKLATHHAKLIVDEAFCDCSPNTSLIPQMPDNAIVFRSFGKFFGLAGLRLGFLIGPASLIVQISHLLGPWAVSGPALAIGSAALSDEFWINNMRIELQNKSTELAGLLRQCGLTVEGENPLFVYASHPKATDIYQGLAEEKILIRSFPLMREHLRFGLTKDEQDFSRLYSALKTVMARI